MADRGARERGGAVTAVSGALAAVAVAVWAVAPAQAPTTAYDGLLTWILLAAAFAIGDRTEIYLEVRKQAVALSLSTVPLAIGLVLVPSGILLSAYIAGGSLVMVSQRLPARKVMFNVAVGTCSVAVATVVHRLLAPGPDPTVVSAWFAVVLAITACLVIEAIAVSLVIRFHEGGHFEFREFASTLLVILPAVYAIDLAAVAVVSVAPALAWTFAVIGGLLHLVSKSSSKVRAHQVHLEQLYDFTDGLATSTELRDLAGDVLGRARDMVSADGAALVLAGLDGIVVHRSTATGVETEVLDHADLHPALLAVLRGDCLMASEGTKDPEHRALLVTFGWRDVIAVPLVGPDLVLGGLLVHDRRGDVATFTDDDLRLLTAAANHAAVAVRNAQLVEGLRAEVLEKAHQATHDALTGLPNRVLYQTRLAQALDDHDEVAVLLMDLDRFKEVNDTLGHPTGDVLLQELGRRLGSALSDGGLVARLGGDEFGVLLPGTGAGAAAAIAHRLLALVGEPFEIDHDLTLVVGASIGVALAPLHGTDPAVLLQRADVAMYEAKDRDDGVALYLAERDRSSRRRLLIASDLDAAIAAGDIALHYQPKVLTATGDVIGFEALARWQHPVHGRIGPDEFILLAEQTGAIHRLTEQVLETAVRQVATWNRLGRRVSVAVNLSPKGLPDVRLPERILTVLDRHGVPGTQLVIELTESATIGDQFQTERSLRALAAAGVKISIDDFGTGHSSLARLRRLPVHELKIDKSFVMELADQRGDEAIVAGIIDLARHLGLRVVAEGVETVEIRDHLAKLGADHLQGYLISAPMDAAAATTWLMDHEVWIAPTRADA
jgi:diguanylate cyclase (GGDEF)-like protein